MMSSLLNWFRLRPRTVVNRAGARRKTSCKLHIEALEDRSLMSAGALDPSFGVGGIAPSAFPYTYGVTLDGAGMAIQADGKILSAGMVYSSTGVQDFQLVRYNANGNLDLTFGTGGKVVNDFGTSRNPSYDYPWAMTLQSDGKVLVAGTTKAYTGNATWDILLVRYNANGTLDTAFGSGGKVTTSFSKSSDEVANAVAVQADGKIVIAGTVADSKFDFALARFNANGTIDTTFGSSGRMRISAPAGAIEGRDNGISNVSMVIQTDGKIAVSGSAYVGGTQDTLIVVARVNANGSLDSTFGTGGKTVTGLGETYARAFGMALQGDGKIVVTGMTHNASSTRADFALVRFTTNGILDNTFDGDGIRTIDFGMAPKFNEISNTLTIQADGKIVVAGFKNGDFTPIATSDFAVARVNANGSLDDGGPNDSTPGDSFGSGGKVIVDTGASDVPYAVAVQSDGKILVVGTSLLRFFGAEPMIGSFSAVPAGSLVTLTASGITDLNPGNSIQHVYFYVDNGDGIFDPNTDTRLEALPDGNGGWTLTIDTTGWISGSHKLFAQALDNYGVFSDPFAISVVIP